MVTAVILAGGIGSRMGSDIPKQFLDLCGRPVIVHTIMHFQDNPRVDSVLVVCNKEWIRHMESLIKDYKLTKVKWVVEGGATGHDSTRNGLFGLKDKMDGDDIVIIHDAARPILPQMAINEMLDIAEKNGNACLAIPCYETIIRTENKGISGNQPIDRNTIMRVQTPQAFRYSDILSAYERAEKENRHDFVYANLVAIEYGATIYFSKGFTNNVKITTKEDLALCEALIKFTDEQLFSPSA